MLTPTTSSTARERTLTSGLRALAALVALVGLGACGSSPTASTSSPAATTATPSPTPSTSPAAPERPKPKPSTATSAAPTDAPVPVESNPPGDIPDNLAFVPYSNVAGGYTFTHPEGWAQTGRATQVTFTDKLNGVSVESTKAGRTPTVATAKATIVPRLTSTVPAFELLDVTPATLPFGTGVHLTFRRNSAPDPVTGKVYRDEVEEYVVAGNGTQVTMDLSGPVGADNVDAYATMSQSLSSR